MVSRGVIIGIVVFLVVLVAVGIGLTVFFVLRGKNMTETTQAATNPFATTPTPTPPPNPTSPSNTTSPVVIPPNAGTKPPPAGTVPAQLFSTLNIPKGQSVTTLQVSKYLTYDLAYTTTTKVPPGMLIQILAFLRDGNFSSTLATEIPIEGYGVYNFYAMSQNVSDGVNLTEVFPRHFRNLSELPNAFVENSVTTQSFNYTYCPLGNLIAKRYAAASEQFKYQALGNGLTYLYIYAYVLSLPLSPFNQIAQIAFGLDSESTSYITPASEINTNSYVFLFYTRKNLTSNSLEILIPSDFNYGSLPPGLISTNDKNTYPFTIYTLPVDVFFRRVTLTQPNTGTDNVTRGGFKVYSTYISYTTTFTDLANLYNASITYTVNGIRYELMANNLSVHGNYFALFYFYTQYNGNTFYITIIFPKVSRAVSSVANLNLLTDGTTLLYPVELWYYN